MGDAKLYSIEDIEKLKQKIASYRDTLTRLKIESSVDGELFMKGEFTNLKASEEVTEEKDDKQGMQIDGAEQRIEEISLQINGLNETVKGLNEELSSILTTFKDSERSSMPEKRETSTDVQNSLRENDKHVEQKSAMIEEVDPPRKGILATIIRQSKNPPSYKQLQSLVGRSDNEWGIPTNTVPKESIDLQKELEGLNMNGKSFPSTHNHPRQFHNGRYRNNVMKSTGSPNKAVSAPAIPVTINEVMEIPPIVRELEKEVKKVERTDPEGANPVVEKEPQKAVVEVEPESQKEVEVEVEPESESQKEVEVAVELEPQEAVVVEVAPESQKEVESEVKPEPQKAVAVEVEPEPEPEPQKAVVVEVEPESQKEVEAEVKLEPQKAVAAEVEPQKAVVVEVEAESQKEVEAEVKPEPQKAVVLETETDAREERVAEIEPIELPSRMKQRERKNKGKLSLFHFFRRGK